MKVMLKAVRNHPAGLTGTSLVSKLDKIKKKTKKVESFELFLFSFKKNCTTFVAYKKKNLFKTFKTKSRSCFSNNNHLLKENHIFFLFLTIWVLKKLSTNTQNIWC